MIFMMRCMPTMYVCLLITLTKSIGSPVIFKKFNPLNYLFPPTIKTAQPEYDFASSYTGMIH